MNIHEPLFIEVIDTLLAHDVEFLLIGGYAVNYYGYGRYTGDIDFWLRPTNENKTKFLQAITILSSNSELIQHIDNLDFTEKHVIKIGKIPHRMDFLTKVNLVEFEEAWDKKKSIPLKDKQLYIVQYEHLILMKINTGRPKDKLDIEELQRINKDK